MIRARFEDFPVLRPPGPVPHPLIGVCGRVTLLLDRGPTHHAPDGEWATWLPTPGTLLAVGTDESHPRSRMLLAVVRNEATGLCEMFGNPARLWPKAVRRNLSRPNPWNEFKCLLWEPFDGEPRLHDWKYQLGTDPAWDHIRRWRRLSEPRWPSRNREWPESRGISLEEK